MDDITLKRIETIHPKYRSELIHIYKEICEKLTSRWECRFTSVFRSNADQDKLFAQKPKVTNARGGESFHNYGLAVDVCLIGPAGASWDINADYDRDGMADWHEMVCVFKKYGWTWGGDWVGFKDCPHFQRDSGLTIPELKKIPKLGIYPDLK